MAVALKSVGRRVARFTRLLGSMRLALALLVLLVIGGVVGGILPQARADEVYRSYGYFWYRVITRLSLDDVFHSSWFLSLVGLLALNLLLCSGRRVRRSVTRLLAAPQYVETILDPAVATIETSQDVEVSCDLAERALRRRGWRSVVRVPSPEPQGTGCQLVARRRSIGTLGPDLIHIGILVILVGALLGIFRQEGTLWVNEWETSQPLPRCEDRDQTGCIPLPYDVWVEDFGVELYGNSDQVKTVWAELSFWEESKQVQSGRIEVNRPMAVAGMNFYTWQYGSDTESALIRLHVFDRARNAVFSEVDVLIGNTATVPGTGLEVTALGFYRAFATDDQEVAADLGDALGGDLAVLLQLAGTNEEGKAVTYRDLALPNVPESDIPRYAFLLVDAQLPRFLELRYVRDPGYPVVWWGFVVLVVGLGGALYFAPRELRATIEPGRTLVSATGRGSARTHAAVAEAIRRQVAEGEV